MRRDSLHMTLLFIGAIPSGQFAALHDIAGNLCGEAFDMQIDRIGFWPHNQIIWVGCSRAPFRQRRLSASLASGLEQTGLVLDKRPFVPHVTLARKVRLDNLPEFPQAIPWRVSEFVLVESSLLPSRASYQVLERWPLQTTADKKISKGC